MANNAKLPDINSLISAGIDSKTGLPLKVVSTFDEHLKANIKKNLRILDEQNAINRYKWYNLPSGLSGQLLERILYYKGQGAFFMLKDNFYFLPYALDGTIDVYGRFKAITPLPFNGTATESEKKDKIKPWITGLQFYPVYEVQDEEITLEVFEKSCVLLKDYSEQISQTNISRQILQDPILDTMAECIPFMRTALINGTGVQGMRVNDEDASASVYAASNSVVNAALNGRKWIPITSPIEFQDLGAQTLSKAEEYLLAMQSLDNFRLSLYGLDNGGLFQKKSHMLEAEQEMNGGNVGLVYQDGLTLRQRFCDIVNSIWNLGIYCEASETVTGMDKNLDGEVADNQDQTGDMSGEQPEVQSE